MKLTKKAPNKSKPSQPDPQITSVSGSVAGWNSLRGPTNPGESFAEMHSPHLGWRRCSLALRAVPRRCPGSPWRGRAGSSPPCPLPAEALQARGSAAAARPARVTPCLPDEGRGGARGELRAQAAGRRRLLPAVLLHSSRSSHQAQEPAFSPAGAVWACFPVNSSTPSSRATPAGSGFVFTWVFHFCFNHSQTVCSASKPADVCRVPEMTQ